MRERLRLSDLSVLYVCLTQDWGTTERRCLADATYFRNIGGSAFILCNEKSLIDREAEKESLPRLYFTGDLKSWRSVTNFYFQLQHILQKKQIDFIHSYNYESLLPLGLILKSLSHIPLVYTFNKNIEFRRSNFFDRLFVSRTDSIFTFSENIKEMASEIFPVNKRKVHLTGAGIDFPTKIIKTGSKNGTRKIGIFVPQTEKSLIDIQLLINSILPILYQLKSIKFTDQLIFSFITDISWYEHPIYEEFKRIILERHLEMNISFETRKLGSTTFKDCDLYIGLPYDELFSDQHLFALVNQIPALLPRTATGQNLVKQGKLGETYLPGDGRELKDKIVKILINHEHYLEELKGIEIDFQDQHHFEKYAEELYGHYERLCAQRLRYAQKKKRLA